MIKVLVADDSLATARKMEKIIQESGDFVFVGHAKDGSEAIKMNNALEPDVICLDMNMPLMDGITALRSLVVLDKQVKIVMVSSLGAAGDRFVEALKLGALDLIAKPFTASDVLRVLRKLQFSTTSNGI